jgi:hypothetical protein
MTRHRTTGQARLWAGGIGMAAAAAAMIGMASAPVARADDGSLATDIGLLDSAQTNVTDGFDVWTQAYGEAPPSSATLTETINQFVADQTPLLSSDNSLLSGLGESLFNGPDQQLATASETFLSAAEAYAADPSTTNGLDAASASLQFDDSLLFDSAPANLIGQVIDQVLHLGDSDIASASAATDLATSVTGGLGPSSAADLAASLDPATVIDPSIFADALSSIGL